MNCNIISLHSICQDKLKMIDQLQEWNLIPRALSCPKCASNLTLRKNSSCNDQWIWRCRKKVSINKKKAKVCDYKKSIRTCTFFARSNLPIFKILVFVHCWVENVPLVFIQKQIEVSLHSCVDWASFCREVLLVYFVNNKMKLGGPGKIVEIDESMFSKPKSHKGHQINGLWVFGVYERGSGRVCMVTLENRGVDSLISLIEEWIEPGTTIISNFWEAYDCSSKIEHLKANYSLHSVDPDSGNHINSIKSSWRAAKAIITTSGRKRAHIPGNLARYMFYKRCTELHVDRTVEFFRIAGEVHCASRTEPVLYDEDEVDVEDLDFL